jgi:uncharacterized protein YuzE
MRITYDARARAAFVYVSDAPIRETREITETVLIDLDDDGNVVGIELLDVDAPTVEDITTRCICDPLPSADAAR